MSLPLSAERAEDDRHGLEEAPPFLGSWRNVYLFLVGELALTVVFFYALTRWAS